MIPSAFTLDAMQASFRDLYAKIKPVTTGDINLSGNRVTNAGQSKDSLDYVTHIEVFIDDPLTFDVNAYFRR